MKTSFLCVPLVLFVFSTTALNVAADPVRDLAGNELQSGVPYYIVPIFWGAGGGPVSLALRNGTCPLDVVQLPRDLQRGLPFTITPVNTEENVIHESYDVTIKYPFGTDCDSSSVWRVESYNGKDILTLGGIDGSENNSFKIEKSGGFDSYKLVYRTGRVVGRFFNNGIIHLALSDEPFFVFFMKVDSTVSSL